MTGTKTWTLELLLYNLSCLLFSGKGFVTCAYDECKDYLEKYYALKFLIRDIIYKHDLSKIYLRELFNLIYIYIDNFSILMLVLISRT